MELVSKDNYEENGGGIRTLPRFYWKIWLNMDLSGIMGYL
jgi:hypothetical protein